jgi:hypothetical protein
MGLFALFGINAAAIVQQTQMHLPEQDHNVALER